MSIIKLNNDSKVPKYKQIVTSIESCIEQNKITIGEKLPSINFVKTQFNLSRDTVLLAYNDLKARGVIESVVGKGYYVKNNNIKVLKKVFLLFDELNEFKEDLFTAFKNSLDDRFQVDIFFHHFNYDMFKSLILNNKDGYNYFVIMPANLKNCKKVLKQVSKNKVYILDSLPHTLIEFPSVYQDFEKNMYKGLTEAFTMIKKYSKCILIYQEDRQPLGLKNGFISFCKENNFKFEIQNSFNNRILLENELYIILDDKTLIQFIKQLKKQTFKLGDQVGVISYNESELKEIIEGGITTISTNFKKMGMYLASQLNQSTRAQIESPYRLIIRNSI